MGFVQVLTKKSTKTKHILTKDPLQQNIFIDDWHGAGAKIVGVLFGLRSTPYGDPNPPGAS